MEYKLTFDQYQQALGEGKFIGLKCESCGETTFPPQGTCRSCGGHRLETAEMKGKGTIRTFTVIRVPPEGMEPPYIIAMVELDEGSWATGRLVGKNPDEADLSLIGQKVILDSQPSEISQDPEATLYILTFKAA